MRARVEEAATVLPDVERVEFRFPATSNPAFQSEAADVHREALRGARQPLRGQRPPQARGGVRGLGGGRRGLPTERDAYRDRAADALDGYDVLLTPTMPMIAPPVGIGDLALRERMISLTGPSTRRAGRPRAPCGPAEESLPASIQIAARRARTASSSPWDQRALAK